MNNENQNRCVFGLHGVTGMLIATVLLLSILVGLTIWGIKTQQDVAKNPYKLDKIEEVKMRNDNLKLNDIRKDAK